jgi:hypothetical protein
MVERLFHIKKGTRPTEKYGALLNNESFISTDMIGVRETLLNVHQLRNDELHPKNIKTGQFHSGQKAFEQKSNIMRTIFPEWLKAIKEILSWYSRHLSSITS